MIRETSAVIDTRPARPPATPLADVARWADVGAALPAGDATATVTGVTLDSRRVRPGDLYVALPGARAHGATFADQAIGSGAAAVLTDAAGPVTADVPVLVGTDLRRRLGDLSARLYGRPAEALTTLGVTGTQGKTTTTRLAEAALQAAGIAAACVGTIGTRVAGEDVKTSLTTPEAPDLHALFAVMREHDVAVCAMEVSSHALVMGRVDGVVFDVAVFLNLGHDHLDFHADLEDYYRAKASLFTAERARRALVCVDDEHGRRLARETEARGLARQTFGLAEDADWRAVDVDLLRDGSRFTVVAPDGRRFPAGVALPGGFNVVNALAALAAVDAAGLDPEPVAAAMAAAGGVPGRLERVEEGQDFLVVVDYAHKPDAVAAAIDTLRPLADAGGGRVLVVLGAGGDRDRGKRPVMGEIAARLADVLVVTDDNPRTEDPSAIRAELLAGTRGGGAEVVEVGDRREAIAEALGRARTGDVVLVAGKGHETGQEIEGVVHPFDDRDVVRDVLRGLR